MNTDALLWSAGITSGLLLLGFVGDSHQRRKRGEIPLPLGSRGAAIVFAASYWFALPLVWYWYGWRKTLNLYLTCVVGAAIISWLIQKMIGIRAGSIIESLLVGVTLSPWSSIMPRVAVAYVLAARHSSWRLTKGQQSKGEAKPVVP